MRIVKEVMAVIRMNMMNQTKKALSDAGISSFTATGRVVGRGKGLVDFKILEGAGSGSEEAISLLDRNPRLVTKRLISVVVPDQLVATVIETIIKVNQTGQPGDGKIFVLPVAESFRVRTGESGDQILDA